MFCSQCQTFWRSAIAAALVPETVKSCEDIRWTQYEIVLHRSMRELKHSSDLRCVICRIILFMPTSYERDALLANDDEELEIVLDIDPTKGPQPILFVTFYEANKAERVARIPKRMVATCDSLLEDEELASALHQCTQLDNNSTGSDAEFELASFWLKRCLDEHENCRNQLNGQQAFMPTRLLDVSNDTIRLIETKHEIAADSDERNYISLSHCWGSIEIIRTKRENYQEHRRGINPAKLSKTFREAVHATRKLGYRYVWIDSLCIIQDSTEDWEAEAATMCDVYRYAVVKIAAAHASGGDIGCYQDRDGLLQVPFVVDVPVSESTNSNLVKSHRIMFTSYGRSQAVGGPEPPLYGRAWVLQEQILSPRMLIFDGSQLRWECNTSHGSERSPRGGMSRHIGHHQVLRAGVFNDEEFFSAFDSDDRDFAARIQVQYWCYAVMEYTHRGMTMPSDRLVALNGIAQAIQRHTTKKYYAGLWEQDIWVGLLWCISHTNEHTPTTTDAFNLEKNKHVRHEENIAPSWSWASVTVPVVYPVPTIIYIERICEILRIDVSGTPAKKRGNLEIRGHIRRGYVDPIYPYSIREAAEIVPNMTTQKPNGSKNPISYRGRSFDPTDYFIFSDTSPSSTFNRISSQNWRLIRGVFRPDEIIDPSTEITFLAIAQRNTGQTSESLIPTHHEKDPLQVWSLALVPTGRVEGEYRRVGYAVWEQCAWYGFLCGIKDRPGRNIRKAEGWRGMMTAGDLEHMGWNRPTDAKGMHEHSFQGGTLPNKDRYTGDAGVEEKTLVIT